MEILFILALVLGGLSYLRHYQQLQELRREQELWMQREMVWRDR